MYRCSAGGLQEVGAQEMCRLLLIWVLCVVSFQPRILVEVISLPWRCISRCIFRNATAGAGRPCRPVSSRHKESVSLPVHGWVRAAIAKAAAHPVEAAVHVAGVLEVDELHGLQRQACLIHCVLLRSLSISLQSSATKANVNLRSRSASLPGHWSGPSSFESRVKSHEFAGWIPGCRLGSLLHAVQL